MADTIRPRLPASMLARAAAIARRLPTPGIPGDQVLVSALEVGLRELERRYPEPGVTMVVRPASRASAVRVVGGAAARVGASSRGR